MIAIYTAIAVAIHIPAFRNISTPTSLECEMIHSSLLREDLETTDCIVRVSSSLGLIAFVMFECRDINSECRPIYMRLQLARHTRETIQNRPQVYPRPLREPGTRDAIVRVREGGMVDSAVV